MDGWMGGSCSFGFGLMGNSYCTEASGCTVFITVVFF